ncbi:hypothetical protein [Beihai picorna-like virus 50]|uniref:hypothetical protein n=1 Tax=Beihai picorna-like virus 50 TaxID=1922595 RepID=UPI0009096901|nr:hypothetical protein [Beihai picorna-like virus 50]APG78898.1 hypothetical protein [Beihai picorna-like virus 50]
MRDQFESMFGVYTSTHSDELVHIGHLAPTLCSGVLTSEDGEDDVLHLEPEVHDEFTEYLSRNHPEVVFHDNEVYIETTEDSETSIFETLADNFDFLINKFQWFADLYFSFLFHVRMSLSVTIPQLTLFNVLQNIAYGPLVVLTDYLFRGKTRLDHIMILGGLLFYTPLASLFYFGTSVITLANGLSFASGTYLLNKAYNRLNKGETIVTASPTVVALNFGLDLTPVQQRIISLFESLFICVHTLMNSASLVVRSGAVINFVKILDFSTSAIKQFVVGKTMGFLKSRLCDADGIFGKLVGLLVAVPLLAKDPSSALKVLSNWSRQSRNYNNIIDAITDVLGFIKEKGAYLLLGKQGDSIQQWYNECQQLQLEFMPFAMRVSSTNVPTDFSIRALVKVEELLEFGKNISVLDQKSGSQTSISRMISQLVEFKAEVDRYHLSSQMRRFPFGVLLWGLPSTGKSWLANEIMFHYGNLFGLPTDPDYMYTFPSLDKYMSGFRTAQWAIKLDDLGALNPKVKLDEKLPYVLDLFQNQPMMSVQAEVGAKAAVPVLSELIIATANNPCIGQGVFNTLEAIQRRFLAVEVCVKKSYQLSNGELDSNRVQGNEEDAFYFHLWVANITGGDMDNVVPETERYGSYQRIHIDGKDTFNIIEILDVLTERFTKHHTQQTRVLSNSHSKKYCLECKLPQQFCKDPLEHNLDADKPFRPVEAEVITEEGKESESDLFSIEILKEKAPLAAAVACSGTLAMLLYKQFSAQKSDDMDTELQTWQRVNVPYTQVQKTTSYSALKQKILNNTYVLIGCDGSGFNWQSTVTAVCLQGNTFITVKHFWRKAKGGYAIIPWRTVANLGEKTKMTVHAYPNMIHLDNDRDWSIFRNDNIPTNTGVIDHWVEGDPQNVTHIKGTLRRWMGDNVEETDVPLMPVSQESLVELGSDTAMSCGFRVPVRKFHSRGAKGGTCGSLLIAPNMNGSGQAIAGLLNAGDEYGEYYAMYTVVGRSDIDEALAKYSWSCRPCPATGKFKNRLVKRPKLQHFDFEHATSSYVAADYFPIGKLPKYNPSLSSKCRPSAAYDFLREEGIDVDKWGPPTFTTPFHMQGDKKVYENDRSPIRNSVLKILGPRPQYAPQAYHETRLQFYEDFLSIIPEGDYSPLTIIEAINGWGELPPLDMSTSFGFPHYGAKSRWFKFTNGQWEPTQELEDAVREILENYQDGRTHAPVFTGTFKDEVRPKSKIYKGKVRMFTAATAPFIIVQRILYGKLLSTYKKLRGVEAHHAYGANHATEWDKLGKSLVMHSPNLLAGDYSDFDGTQSAQRSLDNNDVKYRVMLAKTTKPLFDKQVYDCHAHDLAYPTISIKGDIIKTSGFNTSGNFCTTWDNNLNNVFNIMYGYNVLRKDSWPSFNEALKILVYGDDSLVSSKVPDFNQNTFSKVMESVGIKYTDANKSVVFPDFVNIDDATFLGRYFVSIDGIYTGLLKEESIIRSLAWRSPATSLTDNEHIIECMRSQRLELARYQCAEPGHRLLYLWPKLVQYVIDIGACTPEVGKTLELMSSQEAHDYAKYGIMPSGNVYNIDHLDDEQLSCLLYNGYAPVIRPVLCSGSPDIKTDIPLDVTDHKEATTTFKDEKGHLETEALEEEEEVLSMNLHPYPQPPQTGLADFLSRPLRVFELTLNVGAVLAHRVDLWPLFLNDAAVAAKVRNFALVRGSMMVRIMTNGSPFHYGIGKVAWMPRSGGFGRGNPNDINRASTLPGRLIGFDFSSNFINEFEIPFVSPVNYIDIEETQAGTDTVTPRNRLILQSYTPLRMSNGGTDSVQIQVYIWLKPDTVELIYPVPASGKIKKKKNRESISNGKTAFNQVYDSVMSAELQSNGPVSSMTSAAASAMGYLTDIPIIGDYAQLAEKGLNFTTNVAAFFGYSRPKISDAPSTYVRRPFGNMASVYQQDETLSLALDPKQGITSDGAAVSPITADQMSFNSIGRRWYYVMNATVQPGDVGGTKLLDIGVTPSVSTKETILAGDPFELSNIGLVAWPFDKWTGSIEYLFVAVHARNQTLRVLATYDPTGVNHTAFPSNQQFNVLMDCQPNENGYTACIINVPYAQKEQFKDVLHSPGQTFMTTGGLVYNFGGMNGSLRLTVANPIRGPDPQNVDICVFVRAGPDFQVACPSKTSLVNLMPTSQSGAIKPKLCSGGIMVDLYCDKVCPYDLNTGFENIVAVTYIGSPPDMGATMDIPSIYYGEKIVSFRALIKRYNHYSTFRHDPGFAGIQKVNLNYPPHPLSQFYQYVGGIALGVDFGAMTYGGADTSLFEGWMVNTSNMNYIYHAFYGQRGGVRWKFNISSNDGNTETAWDSVRFRRGQTSVYGDGTAEYPVMSVVSMVNSVGGLLLPDAADNSALVEGFQGTDLDIAPVLPVEVPFYSPFKFRSTTTGNLLPQVPSFDDGSKHMGGQIEILTNAVANVLVESYVAAADDYDLVLFLCSPKFYTAANWT